MASSFYDMMRGSQDDPLAGPTLGRPDETSLPAAVDQGLRVNPDQEMKARQDAEELNLDPAAVRENPELSEEAGFLRMMRKLEGAPRTRQLMSDPDTAAIAHDDVDSLTALERIGASFESGRLQHDLGRLGTSLRGQIEPSPETLAEIERINARLQELGHTSDGWLGFLTASSKILGQQYASFTQPEVAARVAAGGGVGAMAGLAGGVFAPITVLAGTAAGLIAGATAHFITDSFVQEGGHAYLELLEAGVDPDAAKYLSVGVGIINAAFEAGGAAAIAMPFKRAIQSRFKQAVRDAVQKDSVKQVAQRFAKDYVIAVSTEVETEILQEATNIAAEAIGRALTDGETHEMTYEELVSRVEQVAVETFKGMAVLALPGAGTNFVQDYAKVRRAERRSAAVEQFAKTLDGSKMAERAPEVTAQHAAASIEIDAISLPVEAFDRLLQDLGPEAVGLLGDSTAARTSYEEAQKLGGDVTIPTGKFIQQVMIANRAAFDNVKDDIRWGEGEMTANEARQFREEGIDETMAENTRAVQEEAGVEAELDAEEAANAEFAARPIGENVDPLFEVDNDPRNDHDTAVLARKLREEADKKKPVQNEDGTTTITHFSPQEGLTSIDPAFMQTNRDMRGGEASRSSFEEFVPRVYVGLNMGLPGGYRQEGGTGPNAYKADIDAEALYDFEADPDGIVHMAQELNPGNSAKAMTVAEKDIRDAGYVGYWRNSEVGMVGALFQPVEVSRDTKAEARRRRREHKKVENKMRASGLLPPLELAADSLGLQALFSTAKDAGMTPEQYKVYLQKVERAASASNVRKETAALRRQKKALEEQIVREQEEIAKVIADGVRQEPLYAALHGIGAVRLDRQSIIDAYGDDANQVIRELPKVDGRIIVTPRGEPGVHIDQHAELYGFDGGDVMLNAMRDMPTEQEVVAERAKAELEKRHPELFSKQAEIEESLAALMNDDVEAVLAAEIEQLSTNKRKGKLSPKLARQEARRAMQAHAIKNVSPKKYIDVARRYGREAGKALRAGDRAAARDAKVRQLFNFEFAKEAMAVQDKVRRNRVFLRRFQNSRRQFPSVAPGYIEAIRDALSSYSMEARLSDDKRAQLEAFVVEKQAEGVNMELPRRLVRDNKRNWQDMTIEEFSLLTEKVRELHKAGLDEQKIIKGEDTAKIRERVDGIVVGLQSMKPQKSTGETRGSGVTARRAYREAKMLLMNADTMLREIDGFEDLGPAYRAVKQPIDRAMSEGYGTETNIGLLNRQTQVARRMLDIYDRHFTNQELSHVSKRNIIIPGVGKAMSLNKYISTLLNLGNEENRQALIDSGQYTEAQLDAVVNHASKRDMDFVQEVWDYLDEFWPEIKEATHRRRGILPEKVEARPLETKHGTYNGGYYPLKYNRNEGVVASAQDSSNLIAEARFGRAIASHTRHNHTEQRLGSDGRPVLLDMFTTHSHLDQVAYDLELGDATNETYRVLFHNDTKKAFREAGRVEMWDALNLWLADAITGEIHSGGVVEHSLRWLRAGFTISKLAWNVGTIGLQVFGILQTSVVLGKGNTLAGLHVMMKLPWTGDGSVFNFVSEQSAVMRTREATFNKDISDASRLLRGSFLDKALPGRSARVLEHSYFYGIKKMQRLVDTWTWLAAKKHGMELFKNNEAKANEYADRMVIRSQASGNFQERTAMERGSINTRTRQTELARAFTALISYFMAKTNVAYERTKKTNFKNPGEVVSWATDMAILYTVEAALVSLLRGQLPDKEEEGDNYEAALAAHLAGETVQTLFAGAPIIREFVGAAGGFAGGGVDASVADEVRKFFKQLDQIDLDELLEGDFEKIDKALLKSANNLGGVLFHYPSSQINKTAEAFALWRRDEDVDALEFFMGPKWGKYDD